MPRRARLRMAGLPLHLIQRGNNRSACFYADEDYAVYLPAHIRVGPAQRIDSMLEAREIGAVLTLRGTVLNAKTGL